MARIAGVTLPANKPVEVSLTYLYGIGWSLSRKIIADLGLSPGARVKDIAEADIRRLQEAIEKNYRVEGDLRREVLGNIKRLKEIGAYRGMRHAKNLPARGQRTKTNSRTVRGNVRKTMGSGRKKSSEKT